MATTAQKWTTKRVDEVADRVVGRAGIGSTPYIEIGDIDVDTKRYALKDKPSPSICVSSSKGDILISKVRPTRGAITKVQDDVYASLGFSALRPKINSDFLFYSLCRENFLRYLGTRETGTTYPTCDDGDIADYEILVPSDAEQEKIADILSTLDQVIEKTDALIKKYKRVRVGVMQDLIGKVVSRGDKKPLGNLRAFITSGSRGWADYYSDSGALFLRIGNLTRENIGLRFEDIVYVKPPKNSEGNRTKVQAGDVLVSITADLGIIALVPDGIGEAYVNQHIALLRFSDTGTLSPWVALYLSSTEGQRQFAVLNDGGAKAGLNLPTVDGIQIPVPTESERKVIIQSVAAIDKVIADEQARKAKLEAVKAGLMAELLTPTKK